MKYLEQIYQLAIFKNWSIVLKMGGLVSIMALLSVVTFFVFKNSNDLLIEDSARIEIASKQMMLSQRVAVLSEQVASGVDGARKQLEENLAIYKVCHELLRDGGLIKASNVHLPEISDQVTQNAIKTTQKLWLAYGRQATLITTEPLLANIEIETAYGPQKVLGKNPKMRDAIAFVRSNTLKMNELESNVLEKLKTASLRHQDQSKLAIVIISILSVLMAGLVFWIARIYIIRPLTNISDVLNEVATGSLTSDVNYYSTDEIGQLNNSIRAVINNLKKASTFATNIGEGNMNVRHEAAGDDDQLGHALIAMHGNLNSTIQEINQLVKSAGENGELKARLDTSSRHGVWKNLGESVNTLLESICDPMDHINHIISAMANGDLTKKYETKAAGEIKSLATNLNKALDSLNDLLYNISANAKIVDESSEEMKFSSLEMNTNTEEIASAIGEMSSGVQEQVNKVDESSSELMSSLNFSNEMNLQAKNINEAAKVGVSDSQEGIRLVEDAANNMQEISTCSQRTVDSINTLTESSKEIARVLGIITEIASQTNLLSLNAAIEAAQAGEGGRGFAVVAEEIRKLAEDSKKSTKEIEVLIKDVQHGTHDAAAAMQEMETSVKSGEKSFASTLNIFNKITDASQKTLDLSVEIVNVSQNQISKIQNAVTLTEGVVVIAEQTASGTEQIAASSSELSSGMSNYTHKTEELAKVANELKERVGRFKLLDSKSSNGQSSILLSVGKEKVNNY